MEAHCHAAVIQDDKMKPHIKKSKNMRVPMFKSCQKRKRVGENFMTLFIALFQQWCNACYDNIWK